MAKADFFIAGNSKSGTTALQKFLKAHPKIFMTTPKEPFYFCPEFWRDPSPDGAFHGWTDEAYSALFNPARSDQLCGEATAVYLYSQNAAQAIYDFNPGAKIIAMFREPVSFLKSLHLQLLKNRLTEGETIKDFSKAWRLEANRRVGRDLPKSNVVPELLYYREWIKYNEQLKRYTDLFPRGQIKVIVYDDFNDSNDKVYLDVLSFLGVSNEFQPAFEIHNKGGVAVKSKSMQRAVQNMTHGAGALTVGRSIAKAILPSPVRKWMVSTAYEHLVFEPASDLPPQIKDEIRDAARPHVQALSHMLGRDLIKLWRY